MIASVDHATAGALQLLGVPVKLSATPGSVRAAPPILGQHTDTVLRDDLGLSAARIAALRDQQAI
jgi:crotonobetainyl-CoA:carnitine CoA-transferase CaiB-like acyl-CoA transferase